MALTRWHWGGTRGQDGVAPPLGQGGSRARWPQVRQAGPRQRDGHAGGVAVPLGTSGGEAEEIPKGPRRQRGGCQEGVKGSADRHRGSLPGWRRHCGDTPPPSAPSATRWEKQSGRGLSAEGNPLSGHPAPDLSIPPPRRSGASVGPMANTYPPRQPAEEDGARGAMPGGCGERPRAGKALLSAAPPQDCNLITEQLQTNYMMVTPKPRSGNGTAGCQIVHACTGAHTHAHSPHKTSGALWSGDRTRQREAPSPREVPGFNPHCAGSAPQFPQLWLGIPFKIPIVLALCLSFPNCGWASRSQPLPCLSLPTHSCPRGVGTPRTPKASTAAPRQGASPSHQPHPAALPGLKPAAGCCHRGPTELGVGVRATALPTSILTGAGAAPRARSQQGQGYGGTQTGATLPPQGWGSPTLGRPKPLREHVPRTVPNNR